MQFSKLFDKILEVYAYPYKKALYHKKSNQKKPRINIDLLEIEKYRFGFFGELGYSLSAWYPYLNYLQKELNVKIKTAGLKGSSAFVKDFSADHIELDLPQEDMWGENIKIKKELFSEVMLLPSEKGLITVAGKQWLNSEIHTSYNTQHYRALEFSSISKNDVFSKSVVINIKNHFNWGNTSIKNFYTEEDIIRICKHFPDKKVYLNAPKFWKEPQTIYFDTSFDKAFKACTNLDTLDDVYAKCKSLEEVNKLQISILKAADLIFSSQGGNSILALLCNDFVRILMRGGKDYPDYVSLKEIKGIDMKVAYEVVDLL